MIPVYLNLITTVYNYQSFKNCSHKKSAVIISKQYLWHNISRLSFKYFTSQKKPYAQFNINERALCHIRA